MRHKILSMTIAAGASALIFAAGWHFGNSHKSIVSEAEAAGGTVPGPNTVAPDRYVYYPGTEELKPDEIRVIACGTGMPSARRSQAASMRKAEEHKVRMACHQHDPGVPSGTGVVVAKINFAPVFLRHLTISPRFCSYWSRGICCLPVSTEVFRPRASTYFKSCSP